MNKLMKNISFTKNETKVILFVIAVLVTGFSIKFYKQVLNSPSLRFDYTTEDSVFKALSELSELSEGKLNPDKISDTDSINTLSSKLIESIDDRPAVLLNINTATKPELIDLPGIGESTADKIISYREQNKKFNKPEDIMKVSGIGKKKFDKLKDLIKTE